MKNANIKELFGVTDEDVCPDNCISMTNDIKDYEKLQNVKNVIEMDDDNSAPKG